MTSAVQPLSKNEFAAKPFLKWAGGKSQLLPHLLPLLPARFEKYIEPFVGAGALFFALGHQPSIIADSNEELIVTYTAVRDDLDRVIEALEGFTNDQDSFYQIRAWNPQELTRVMRAARLIYLNKTCFNGLYRVNRRGQFNTPYNGEVGRNFLQRDLLQAASKALQGVEILHGDYKSILKENADGGDLIFLDPPYQPVGKYSDFKRYTKERFHEDDHVELANEFRRLVELGCKVILTNSTHESILELYKEYDCKIIGSKRLISSDSSTRNGTDLIVLGGF